MAGKCPKRLEEEFIRDAEIMPVPLLAETYGKSHSTIKEWRVDLYRRKRILWYPGIRVSDAVVYDDHVIIEGDAIVLGDIEIPYQDHITLGYAISIAKKFGVKNLVMAGDSLANDAFGYFAARAEDTDESVRYTLADSLMEGGEILKELFRHFAKIVMIKGNHESRAAQLKEVGFFNMMADSWEDLGDLELSFYKWCVLMSGGVEYRIEHFGNFSKAPGSVARDRAEIEQANTLGGHTHHMGMTFSKCGNYVCGDLGHATRPETRYYKAVNGTTRHPKWIRGFWMIRNGYAYPFPIDFTDWDFWLRGVQLKKGKEQ